LVLVVVGIANLQEFLRKKLIGKTVRCVFDYSQTEKDDKFTNTNTYVVLFSWFFFLNINSNNRQQQQKQPTVKNYYSIYEGKTNVALELVRQGFGMNCFTFVAFLFSKFQSMWPTMARTNRAHLISKNLLLRNAKPRRRVEACLTPKTNLVCLL
jgi:hypothetical protein